MRTPLLEHFDYDEIEESFAWNLCFSYDLRIYYKDNKNDEYFHSCTKNFRTGELFSFVFGPFLYSNNRSFWF